MVLTGNLAGIRDFVMPVSLRQVSMAGLGKPRDRMVHGPTVGKGPGSSTSSPAARGAESGLKAARLCSCSIEQKRSVDWNLPSIATHAPFCVLIQRHRSSNYTQVLRLPRISIKKLQYASLSRGPKRSFRYALTDRHFDDDILRIG